MRWFKASWCTALHAVSWSALAIVIAASVIAPRKLMAHHHEILSGAILLALLLLVGGCALFTVRGFAITPDAILIRRLLWNTPLPRAGLLSATADPAAMQWTIRTFGNGGFFSFSGFYWNKRFCTFRVYVTDPRNCVVLKFTNRTVVVSPDEPEAFARELQARGLSEKP